MAPCFGDLRFAALQEHDALVSVPCPCGGMLPTRCTSCHHLLGALEVFLAWSASACLATSGRWPAYHLLHAEGQLWRGRPGPGASLRKPPSRRRLLLVLFSSEAPKVPKAVLTALQGKHPLGLDTEAAVTRMQTIGDLRL